MLMVVCMIVGILLAVINKYSPSEWSKISDAEDKTNSKDSFNVNNALFFVHSTVCWQGRSIFLVCRLYAEKESVLFVNTTV